MMLWSLHEISTSAWYSKEFHARSLNRYWFWNHDWYILTIGNLIFTHLTHLHNSEQHNKWCYEVCMRSLFRLKFSNFSIWNLNRYWFWTHDWYYVESNFLFLYFKASHVWPRFVRDFKLCKNIRPNSAKSSKMLILLRSRWIQIRSWRSRTKFFWV